MLVAVFGDFPLGVVGLIMAGGRGTRMGSDIEKPLISTGGKTMLELVVEALKGASGVERIVVATSCHTPRTREVAEKLGLEILQTDGQDYVTDAQQAIWRLVPRTVLVISADLPLVSSHLLDEIIGYYAKCGKPSMKVVTLFQPHKSGDPKRSHSQKDRAWVRPVGINIIDSRHINEPYIDEAEFTISSPELVLNVNTPEDLERALRRKSVNA